MGNIQLRNPTVQEKYIAYDASIDANFPAREQGNDTTIRVYVHTTSTSKSPLSPLPEGALAHVKGQLAFWWRARRDVTLHTDDKGLTVLQAEANQVPDVGKLKAVVMGVVSGSWTKTETGRQGMSLGRVDLQLAGSDDSKTKSAIFLRTDKHEDLVKTLKALPGSIATITGTFVSMGYEESTTVPVFDFDDIHALAIPKPVVQDSTPLVPATPPLKGPERSQESDPSRVEKNSESPAPSKSRTPGKRKKRVEKDPSPVIPRKGSL